MAELALLVVRCQDLELSRLFYEKLGVTFNREQHGAGPIHYSTTLGTTVLELYPASGRPTHIRLGLRINDFSAIIASIPEAVLRVDDKSSLRSALVHDPDGNSVELTNLEP
jgi:hypothetical protein